MCDKCSTIDRDLVRFQHLQATIDDKFALALIIDVIKDLQSERAALHSEDANKSGE